MISEKGSKLLLVAIVALVLLSVLLSLETIELRAEEPRRAAVAIEMYESGDLIRPTISNESYYNKPPLYGWVLSGFMALFNSSSEWVIRLPGVLSFLLTGLFLFLYARKYLEQRIAIIAALGYITSSHLLYYGSVNAGEIDLFYGLITMLQVVCIFHFSQKQQWLWLFLCSYLLASIGVLTKGIPSILFQGVTLLAWLIYLRRFWKLFSWQHLVGFVVFAGIIVGYFYSYGERDDVLGYITKLVDESSERSFNETSAGRFATSFLTFPALVLAHTLPLGIGLLLLIKRRYRDLLRQNELLKFSVVFVLANIVFYWIMPDFRARYLYMFFPFLFIISGVVVHHFMEQEKPKRVVHSVLAFLLLAMGVMQFVLLFVPMASISASPVFMTIAGLVMTGLAWCCWKFRSNWQALLFFFLALVVSRFSFNVLLQPQMQANVNHGIRYRALTKELVELAGDNNIQLLGRPQMRYPKMQLLGTTFHQDTVRMATHVPFQFHYYYYQNTGQVLAFDDKPKDGQWYIGYQVHLDEYEDREVMREFKIDINNHTFELVRFPETP